MTTKDCGRPMHVSLAMALLLTALLLGACSSRPDAKALGTSATTEFVDQVSGTHQGSGTVTVTGVRRGSTDELAAAFDLHDDEQSATPFYVDVTFANEGAGPVDLHSPSGVAGDDRLLSPLVVVEIGDAPTYTPCPALPEHLDAGESAEGCAIVLVPDGVTLERVAYQSGPGAESVYWAAA